MAKSLLCHLFCEHVNLQCAFRVFPSTSSILSQTSELKVKISTSCKWIKVSFPEVATEIGNWVGLSSVIPGFSMCHQPCDSKPGAAVLLCLPRAGRFAGGFWRREKHWILGKHPEFGENILNLGQAQNVRGFWGSCECWGEFLREFWGFQRGRMEQVLVAWLVSGLVSCGFAVPGLSCPCDCGKSDAAADLGRVIYPQVWSPLLINNLLQNIKCFPQGNLKGGRTWKSWF